MNIFIEEKTKPQKVLKLCFEHAIISLDPRVGGDQSSALILKMLFEGLMRLDRDGKLEKALAADIHISPDQKIYTFYLRPTYWNNGIILTAYDFEYAWKKVLSPSFSTSFAYLLYPIKNAKEVKQGTLPLNQVGISAVDSSTLKVELEYVTPYFLDLLANPVYSPVHFSENPTLSNGAFKIYRQTEQEYRLIRNSFYWDHDNIQLDEIQLYKACQKEAYELFQQGLIDWVGPPTGMWSEDLLADDSSEDVCFYDNNVFWLVLNTKNPFLNQKKFRRALLLAIDKLKLQQTFHVLSAWTPLPVHHSQIKQPPFFVHALEEAHSLFKQALKDLEVDSEQIPPLVLTYLGSDFKDKVMKFIKEQWEAAFNIQVILESITWKDLIEKMGNKDFMIIENQWAAWINDPIYTLNVFRYGGQLNATNWENATYKAILAFADKQKDRFKRDSLYLQAERLLIEEAPIIPLFTKLCKGLKKKHFQMIYFQPLMDFKWGFFH